MPNQWNQWNAQWNAQSMESMECPVECPINGINGMPSGSQVEAQYNMIAKEIENILAFDCRGSRKEKHRSLLYKTPVSGLHLQTKGQPRQP
jgi:hypothetical protein